MLQIHSDPPHPQPPASHEVDLSGLAPDQRVFTLQAGRQLGCSSSDSISLPHTFSVYVSLSRSRSLSLCKQIHIMQ